MHVTAWFFSRLARGLAHWGELCQAELLELSLPHALRAVEPVTGVLLRQATAADIDEIIGMYADDPWLYLGDPASTPQVPDRVRELYLDRLRRGEECWLAMSGDQIAHVNWNCYSWGDALPALPLQLHPGEIFTTDAVTRPAFRGHGLHAFVLWTMLDHARRRGIRHAYTLARVDRHATYKALREVGYRRCGRLVYFLPKGKSRPWILARQGKLEALFRAG